MCDDILSIGALALFACLVLSLGCFPNGVFCRGMKYSEKHSNISSLPFSECRCVVGHKSRNVVWLGVAEQGDAFICMANPENNA